jgi:hypothetical protein
MKYNDLFTLFQFAGEEKFVSQSYVIENMDRHKGGTYICTASNGVGQTASSQIVLHVLCKYKHNERNLFICFCDLFWQNNGEILQRIFKI